MKILVIILFLLFTATAGIFTGKNLFLKQKDELYNTKVHVYQRLKIDKGHKKVLDKAPPDRQNPNGEIQKNYIVKKSG